MTFFNADFASNCLVGDCEGWHTKGQYYSATMHNGKNQLRIRTEISGPSNIRKREVNARWVIGDGNGKSEVLNCMWKPNKRNRKKKKKKGRCTSSLGNKEVNKWHKEEKDPFKMKSNAPELWRNRKIRVRKNKMTIKAVRYYEQPDEYSRWETGEQKSTFITFRDGPTDIKIGRSNMIDMFLYDPVPPLVQADIKMVPLIVCTVLASLIALLLFCLCVTWMCRIGSSKTPVAEVDSAKKRFIHESLEDQNTDRSNGVPKLPTIIMQKAQKWDELIDIPIPEYDIDKPKKDKYASDEENDFRPPVK